MCCRQCHLLASTKWTFWLVKIKCNANYGINVSDISLLIMSFFSPHVHKYWVSVHFPVS